MKSSLSCKDFQLLTDHHSDHYPINQCKYTQTAKFANHHSKSINKMNGPQSCKNINRSVGFKRSSQPSQKISDSGSKRRKHSADENIFLQRKLDHLCFQRLITQFKRYLMEEKQMWNLHTLNYPCLIKMLWIFRYIPHPSEESFISKGENEELKKIYYFWLVISSKKFFSLVDFFILVSVIQNLDYDTQYIESSLVALEKQLCQHPLTLVQTNQCDPKYIFFLKKLNLARNKKGYLQISNGEKEKIISYFKSFKLNKLKDYPNQNSEDNEEQTVTISKKSHELAESKRKKMVEEIRASNPKIQKIDLADFLSYRQRDHERKTPTSVAQKKKQFPSKSIKEIKKQIEVLSKPKQYLENRTSDEISFEKNKDQYTFHPKVHSYQHRQKANPIKNADKAVLRMKEARQIKEEKENILQKGWAPKNQPKHKLKITKKQMEPKQPEKEEKVVKRYEVAKDFLKIPLLYIDVNIEEGRKERIIIYDNDRAGDLAAEFGHKHKLPPQTIGRLETMLQQQIDSVLTRIEEQTDEQSSMLY